jgi:hypothetical protein
VKNKVMVDGVATKEGVKAYCKERSIPIVDQEELKKQREAKNKERDSVLAIRTQEKMAKKFELTLKNNADSSVYIFIGDTTASKSSAKKPEALPFRQGRYELVNGKEEKSLTAKYMNAELGTGPDQVARILSSNYKWKKESHCTCIWT